jgi:hypothetical protein
MLGRSRRLGQDEGQQGAEGQLWQEGRGLLSERVDGELEGVFAGRSSSPPIARRADGRAP